MHSESADPPFHLRLAVREDAPQLFHLLNELANFEHLPPPDKGARERLLQDGWGPRKRFDAYLAFVPQEEAAVGFCIIFETYSTFLARPRLFVEDLYVQPQFRHRGIGRALIRLCLEEANRRGCHRVECMGLDWNAKAHDIYLKMGASELSEWFLYRFEKRMIDHNLGLSPRRRF